MPNTLTKEAELLNLTTVSSSRAPHQTEVTVKRTEIKMVNEDNNVIRIVNIYGKLNVIDSKKHSKRMGCTYISKNNIEDVFYVASDELIKIKECKGAYTI